MLPQIKTQPDLSIESPAHMTAYNNFKNGSNEHLFSYECNVKDEFKSKTQQEIKDILKATANPFAVVFENWAGGRNVAAGIRNANAFNAIEAFYLGLKRFDRRSAMGCHNYLDVKYLDTIDKFLELKKEYIIIGADNIPGSVPMETFEYDKNKKYLFVFGEEACGLTPGMQKLCDAIIHISMYGSIRSLNCATASGIIMYDFVRKIS